MQRVQFSWQKLHLANMVIEMTERWEPEENIEQKTKFAVTMVCIAHILV